MHIVLVGGGTGGSVGPLLAVSKELAKLQPGTKFTFIGGIGGVERGMAEHAGVPFFGIHSGKLRRYFSLLNLLTPFQVVWAFFESRKLLKKLRPNAVFGAGSFVQVPVAWAAWMLGIPVVLHQQDVQATLSNKLCAPVAKKITVTFEKSIYDFPQDFGMSARHSKSKLEWTGNPCMWSRPSFSKDEAVKFFGLDPSYPTVLITGGGTGAQSVNDLVFDSLPQLTRVANIIHITGAGKGRPVQMDRYVGKEFLKEMDYAYTASDIVVSRAGLGTITELSFFKKPSIIIPMPKSHQEDNAYLLEHLAAALVTPQGLITKDNFAIGIKQLLFNKKLMDGLSEHISKLMPSDGGQAIAKIIINVAQK